MNKINLQFAGRNPSATGTGLRLNSVRRAARVRRSGMILILVMAVLGLLLILGTGFISVTSTDRASTANIIRSTQADLAVKSAFFSAAEMVRRDLFDPSGQYLLTGGVRMGPMVTDENGLAAKDAQGKPGYNNVLVGEYMDLPDPDVDEWLSPIEPESSGGQWVLSNVARIGTPLPPARAGMRDFRFPANCRNVPAIPPDPQLVDVDGDGYHEGVWCVLPISGTGGEQWEAAYKIIDLGGLVNLNAAVRPITQANETYPLGVKNPLTNQAENLTEGLARFQTGAEPNGFLYESFVQSLANGQPGNYSTIPFYPRSPVASQYPKTYLQLWSLLGLALNPHTVHALTGTNLNTFGLADELEFRYSGGISGRIPKAGATSDQWMPYQSGRGNIFTLLECVPGCDPGINPKRYFTALSAMANYMVGDPRAIHGVSIRDGTLRGTSSPADATKVPTPRTLCSIWTENPNNPNDRQEKNALGRARQYRLSIESLVVKAVNASGSERDNYMTELADTFRYALDGYVDASSARAFVGDPVYDRYNTDGITPAAGASLVDPMDQLAAHMTANFVSLADGNNNPVVFTYRKGEKGEITVVGVVQFPLIQSVNSNGSSVTMFNPWDTNVSPSTMRIIQKIGDTPRTLDKDSTPLYGTDSKSLSPAVNLDSTKGPTTVYLVHQDAPNIIIDAWNRDGKKANRGGSVPTGAFGGPWGCAAIFPRDPGVNPILNTCQIHLNKPHVNILRGNYNYSTVDSDPFKFTKADGSSIHLTYRSRWMTAADVAMLPTFGGILPKNASGNLLYDKARTWADRAAQCQAAANANIALLGPGANTGTYGEPGKINFRKPGTAPKDPDDANKNLTMGCGFDQLTPGQRLFAYITKIDPLTDGYGADINNGAITHPLSHLDTTLYGMININTAPSAVLKYLPWTNSPGPAGSDRLITGLSRDQIAAEILNYRTSATNRGGFRGFLSIAELVNLPSLRVAAAPSNTRDPDYRVGSWWGAADSPAYPGADKAPVISGIGNDKMLGWDKVRGDLKERDLLFRNVCSMITTRSDVFCIYVVVRSRNVTSNQVSSLRRVYGLLDRTQVRNITDAAKVWGPFDNNK